MCVYSPRYYTHVSTLNGAMTSENVCGHDQGQRLPTTLADCTSPPSPRARNLLYESVCCHEQDAELTVTCCHDQDATVTCKRPDMYGPVCGQDATVA